jgi:hypothetical protein
MITIESIRTEQASDRDLAELLAGTADDLIIEDLDHAAPVTAPFTYCG